MNTGNYSENNMDAIWWGQITKANHFIQTIANSILDHNSIVVSLPERMPWERTFYDNIEGILRQGNPEYKLKFHDCPTKEAGEFLLEEYSEESFKTFFSKDIISSKSKIQALTSLYFILFLFMQELFIL